MGRGRGRPKFKGHSRHFTNRDELEADRKKEEEKQRKRDERGYDVPSSSSSEESEEEQESGEEDEEGKEQKNKGVEGIIEIQNPNRSKKVQVKTTEVAGQSSQLTRRQKEELARQNYQRLQLECKTEQAQNDLARLALIRKRREEEAAKGGAKK